LLRSNTCSEANAAVLKGAGAIPLVNGASPLVKSQLTLGSALGEGHFFQLKARKLKPQAPEPKQKEVARR
jgi:hypothetical protein